MLDATTSYQAECPPSYLSIIERRLQDAPDDQNWLQKKAIALCRQSNWDGASEIISKLLQTNSAHEVFAPGWWAIHETHASSSDWMNLVNLPESDMEHAFRWYAPIERANGFVASHQSVPYLICPVYCANEIAVELVHDLGDADTIWINGEKILDAKGKANSRKMECTFHAGWNMIVAEFDRGKNLRPGSGCAVRIVGPAQLSVD